MWAVDQGDGTVRLDNIPWFVRGIACGDIVATEADEEEGGTRHCAMAGGFHRLTPFMYPMAGPVPGPSEVARQWPRTTNDGHQAHGTIAPEQG